MSAEKAIMSVEYDEVEPASIEKVLEFCNAVREAGGANPLDALLPSVPAESDSCLIARNLNFSCTVTPIGHHLNPNKWIMLIEDEDTFDEIFDNLVEKGILSEQAKYDSNSFYLPPDIAKVAIIFDEWSDLKHRDRDINELHPYAHTLFEFIEDDYVNFLKEERILPEDYMNLLEEEGILPE